MVQSLSLKRITFSAMAVASCALMGLDSAYGQATPSKVTVDAVGTVHADGVVVPLSDMLSPEAKAMQLARLMAPPYDLTSSIANARATVTRANQPFIDQWLKIYPTKMTAVQMNGVSTVVMEPMKGIAPENAHRVLISLHGGGFFAGTGNGALVEAIPVSGAGQVKVVAVNYRLAPESLFPAASEDVESVYRKLLETYKPENIGIYGCSAGGTLTAQSVAWFQKKGLPRPGAVGVFCSGAMQGFWYGGDAQAVTPMMNGQGGTWTPEQMKANPGNLYLAGKDRNDPLVTPGQYPEVLAKFPPTLILTGTRDNSMSNALVTNMRMLDAGAETQLLVLEGIGHGEFNALPGTPEATMTFKSIWRFFDKHLAH
jgi:monoterpene epsilon-lactone hydrolase